MSSVYRRSRNFLKKLDPDPDAKKIIPEPQPLVEQNKMPLLNHTKVDEKRTFFKFYPWLVPIQAA